MAAKINQQGRELTRKIVHGEDRIVYTLLRSRLRFLFLSEISSAVTDNKGWVVDGDGPTRSRANRITG